ncbi:MAG: Xaa-Pro peptidase family protein [Candidatus Omnitrophica bacterium]|nr:Xaa-Pro peptidase family protein [Candidatus Omnitrophota bacterium]
MSYTARQRKLTAYLKKESIDAFLVRKKENISYLTGARGEDAVLFVSAGNIILITDSRYEEEYKKNAGKCSVRIAGNKNLLEIISETCAETGSKFIGFEADNFSYQAYANLKKRLGGRKLIPLMAAVEDLRIIKDKSEIRYIRQACKYGVRLMNYAVKAAKPGISENSVKRVIEAYALENNIDLASFDIIVASGVNASMPHAAATERRIKKQEMVTIDLGAMYFSYNSDLTRTVFLGRINHNYSHAYDIVLASQAIAIESLKPGVYAKDVDAVSRQYISDRGMGSFFLHSLGHGIGRETHEIPAISQSSKIKLEKGMVITIEPGIYIPGWGGIRIEDTVLITENGCEVLTKGAVKYAGRNQ